VQVIFMKRCCSRLVEDMPTTGLARQHNNSKMLLLLLLLQALFPTGLASASQALRSWTSATTGWVRSVEQRLTVSLKCPKMCHRHRNGCCHRNRV
jgi:hypothetical protein